MVSQALYLPLDRVSHIPLRAKTRGFYWEKLSMKREPDFALGGGSDNAPKLERQISGAPETSYPSPKEAETAFLMIHITLTRTDGDG